MDQSGVFDDRVVADPKRFTPVSERKIDGVQTMPSAAVDGGPEKKRPTAWRRLKRFARNVFRRAVPCCGAGRRRGRRDRSGHAEAAADVRGTIVTADRAAAVDGAGDRLRAVLPAVAVDKSPASTAAVPAGLAPWPFRDLTTVHLHRQPVVVPGPRGGGPVAVTVSHGGALRPGHLDGRYADAGVDGAAYTQLVLLVRLPVERDVRPAYRATAAGRCDVAAVTRPDRSTGGRTMVVEVPVVTDSRHQPVATVRVLRPDGAELDRFSRWASGDEIVCAVRGRYSGFVGAVDRIEYRQRVGPHATEVDLVLVGPAIFCNAHAVRQSFLRRRV